MNSEIIILLLSILIISFVYSSVGHGGASGYLAIMALMGVAPMMMKPSALIMNIIVSFISFAGFYSAGHFRFRLFFPFAIASVPMAFLGGTMSLPDELYKKILAACLVISVIRLLYRFRARHEPNRPIPLWGALLAGGMIGMLSGMIGIGGGIILSPLLLIMRWASLRETAAVSALFIFVNSMSGLYGQITTEGIHLTEHLQYAVGVAILGGVMGSYFGSKKFNVPTLRYLLACGLMLAAFKLIMV